MKKRFSKVLSVLLAAVILVTGVPLSGFVGLDIADFDLFSFRAEAASGGECGDNVKWKLDDEGTMTISGTGEMYSYSSSNDIPWANKKSKIKKVVIKKGVTSVTFCAFADCENLKSVEIANSAETIGDSAFAHCENLKTIEIPDSVETIDDWAFFYCESLKNINVSSKNRYYSSKNGVLFDKNKTKLICYPSGKTATSYTIPNSVFDISGAAFSNKYLESISISKNVSYISGNSYFIYCSNLKSIDVSSDNKYFSSKSGVLFDKDKTTLLKYPAEKSSASYTVPDSVKYINGFAFEYSNKLTSIKISNSVKEIGQWSFGDCEKLKDITIGNNVVYIDSYAFADTAYYNDSSNWKNGILYLGKYLIAVKYWESGYSTNGSCTIKSGTKLIANDAFMYCNELKSITIPDSVLYIGDQAFDNCSNLKSVKIGKNVKKIGDSAFGYDGFDSKISGFKIYGQKGSAAETYAKENGFKFVSDSSSHSHSYTSKVTKKATTSKSGTQKFTCLCGKSYTKTIAKISSVKLSNTSFTYNGKVKKPTVTVKDSNGKKLKSGTDYTVSYSSGRKNIGTYTVTVTFKGKYSGSKKLTFKIVPGKVTGIKQENKKGINFKWNSVKGASGYQVYRYNSSKGKYVELTTVKKASCGNSKAKGSMKIKIRAYKLVGERVYYGAFSDPVTLKAKK